MKANGPGTEVSLKHDYIYNFFTCNFLKDYAEVIAEDC